MQHNVSIRQILSIAILVACPGLLWTQVTIKERVEITPKPPAARSVVAGTSQDLFVENPNFAQGPNAGAALIIVKPCSITASGSIQVTPGTFGEYPNTTLSIYVDGAVIASYNKTQNTEVPAYMSQSHTAERGCGYDGALLTSVSSLEGTIVDRTVGPSSATIKFEGRLMGSFRFVATVTLAAIQDTRYDLGSLGVSIDRPSLTVCQNTAQVYVVLKDNKGDAFGGNPCSSSITPMYITVQSASEVVVNCRGQQGKQISVPVGDNVVAVIWNSQGETQNSQATITVSAESMSKSVSVELSANQQAQGVMIQTSDFVQYQLKTDIIISGLACDMWGPIVPLPNGTQVDVSVIEGSQWGYLRDPLSHRQGTSLQGLSASGGVVKLEYWAKGEEPRDDQWVQLQATAFGSNVDCWLAVVGNDLRVRPGRSQLAYGDTTKIVIERSEPSNGNYSTIPPDWNTMYEIVEADTAGYLCSVDSVRTGAKIYGRDPEARFYAKDFSSQPDSVNITIRVIAVEPWETGGELTKANDGVKPKLRPDTLKQIPTNFKGGASGGKKTLTMAEEPPDFWSGLPYFGILKLVVKKKDHLHHFKVTMEKDTIAFTETAKIFVQSKDASDADIELDAGTRLKLWLTANEEFGTFINKKGDTLKASPAELNDIPYGDLKAGSIRFAALKKNPDSVVTCRVRAELQNDSNKKGDTNSVVVEQTLKIVMTMPYVVRPSIPTEDNDTTMVRLRTKQFEVRMTRAGKPIEDHPFRLWTNYVDSTGGHMHKDTRNDRRADNNDNYGYFLTEESKIKQRPLDSVTNSKGRIRAFYGSSIFGDTMKIYLKSKKNKLLCDSMSLVEKVDSLLNFKYVNSNSRWIFVQSDTGKMRHGDNNWCLRDFADSVKSAIDDFYGWSNSKKGAGKAIVVSLNDMSLILGGRFDMNGKWGDRPNGKHLFHRIGTSLDINGSALDTNQVTFLTQFMQNHELFRDPERPEIHYGFRKGN